MKPKLAISSLLIGIMLVAFFAEIPTVRAHWPMVFDQYGPHVEQILTKLFSNAQEMFTAFDACAIDLVDQPVTAYWINQWQNRPDINMMNYGGEIAEDEFDINNNETKPDTPYGGHPERNIGHDPAFRHAVAHLIDRNYIITTILKGFGFAEYTKIPLALGGWVNPNVDQHPYSPSTAASVLAIDDFHDTNGDGYFDWPGTPNGQSDRILVDFVVTVDDTPGRYEAGKRLIWEMTTNIRAYSGGVGFYVQEWDVVTSNGDALVKSIKGHTIYTSYKKFKKDPDYLYTYYHSSMYWHPGACPNYNNVNDTELDGYLEGLYYAQSYQEALINCHAAQECMHREGNVFVVPVCSRTAPKAGKTHYMGPELPYHSNLWEGFVNEFGFGLNCWWTFLNAHPAGYEWPAPINTGPMLLRYGFSVPQVPSLNPLYGDGYWDWEVMGKVYDTLLRADPYNLAEDLEWVAKRWEVGTWVTPNGQEATKIVFELRDDVYWHDGQQLDADDIVFTFKDLITLLQAAGCPRPWFYSNVKDIYDIVKDGQFKVTVKFNVKSYFALHWLGELPILPEHVWRPIVTIGDPTVFAPDAQLIGAGPFKVYPHSIDPTANDYYVPNQFVKLDAYYQYFNNYPIRVSMATHGSYIDAYLQNYHNTTITASVSVTIDGTPSPGVIIADVPPRPGIGDIPGVRVVHINATSLPKTLHNIAVTVGYTFGGQAISDTFSRQLLAPSVDGDITNDGTVGLLDAIHLSFHFGLKAWVWPEDDVKADVEINVLDAIILVQNWGQSDP